MRRAQFDSGSQPIRNLFTNPSCETANGTGTVRTNHFTNPAMESSSGNGTLRTNLATNPSFEATSGIVNVRTNLAMNPSFETASGTTNVRTNLVTNPSMETASGTVNVRTNLALDPSATATTNWGNIGSPTYAKTLDTAVFHEGTSAVRFTLSSSGALGGKCTLSGGVTSGETVSWSVWVYPSVACSFQPYWERATPTYAGGTGGSLVTCPANTWTKITGSVTFSAAQADAAGSFGFGFYNGGNAFVANDFFVADEIIIEKMPLASLSPFFSGATTAAGDFTYVWAGTANQSASYQRAAGVTQWLAINATSKVWQSLTDPIAGTKSAGVRCSGIAAGEGIYLDPAVVTGYVAGDVYTGSATVKGPAGVTAEIVVASLSGPLAFTNFTFTGLPQRVSASLTLGTGATSGPYILVRTKTTAQAVEFFVDAAMIEKTSVLQPYFDGANPITNLVGNPSMTTDIAGWVGKGSTLPTFARDTTRGWSGGSSLKVTGTSAAMSQGVGYNVSGLVVGQRYTMSGYVYVPTGSANVVSTISNIGYGTETGALRDQWVRLVMTFTATATTHQPGFDTNGNSQIGTVYYVDGVQLEKGVAASTYLEGQGDFTYAWSGTANASTSYQQAPGVASWAGIGRLYQSKTELVQGTYSGAVATNGVNGDGIWPATNIAISANTAYTFSAWVKATSAHALTAAFRWADSVGASAGADTTVLVTSQLVVGSWVRISASATSPSTAATLQMLLRVYETHTPTVFYMDGAMVSTSPDTAYFDGATPAAGDFTYAWSGTANASTSYQQAPGVFNSVGSSAMAIVQSSDWKLTGGKSVRIIPLTSTRDTAAYISGITFVTGKTYTISATCRLTAAQPSSAETRARKIVVYHSATSHQSSAAPNTAGTTRLSVTFAVTDGAAYTSVRLYNGGSQGEGDVWWDDVLIEETSTLRDYFDGTSAHQNLCTNPSFETDLTGWSGAGSPVTVISRVSAQYLSGGWALKMDCTALNNGGFTSTGRVAAISGDTFTLSAYLKGEAGKSMRIESRYLDTPTTGLLQTTTSATIVADGTWQRLSVTHTAPSNTAWVDIVIRNATNGAHVMYADAVLIEKALSLRSYYEGSGDVTYAWTGTANASTSLQRAPLVTGLTWENGGQVYRDSTSKLMSGIYSGKMLPGSGDVYSTTSTTTVGQSWTLSMDYRTDGILTGNPRLYIAGGGPATTLSLPLSQPTTTRVSVTLPVTATGVTSVVAAIFAATTGEFWIDNVLIEQTSAALPHFDGSTAAAGDFTYMWTGTAHASTSQQRAPGVNQITTGNCWPIHSSEWSASGGKSLRLTGINQYNTTSALLASLPLENGKTYTVLATRRLPAPLTGTLSSYAGSIISVQTGVGTFSSPSLPNVAGVAQARYTFKLDENSGAWSLRLGHGGVAGSGDVWWDNIMVVEGEYTGDHINPTQNVLAKWDGTADASTSVGYSPQFLDIAGKPSLDLATIGASSTSTVDGFAPRTFYAVYEVTDVSGAWNVPFNYGLAASTDGWSLQTSSAGNTSMSPRADFASGGGNTNAGMSLVNARTSGRIHVVASAFNQGLTNWTACANGGADSSRTLVPGTVGWTSHRISVNNYTGIRGIRGLVFMGEHDRDTRLAISRYLGNKYGANVA